MRSRHLRRRAAMAQKKGRAWAPRVMYRIPRFRWKVCIECQRRFVFVREPDEITAMKRGVCRSFRRMNLPSHRKAA
jgi:hypothetical protein